ncbi:MAG: holo-ACP synthase [Nitrospinae bacterium]|nr:holo-ACP synthase [Nitrospinota bacterium]
MIFGTGLDIIEIDRIKKSLAKYSPRFENRVFTDEEISYCQSQADPGKHFAARFAVKEAVSKSLGTGINHEVGFKDIEVINQTSGKPIVRMGGRGKKLFEKLNLKSIHISISHDRHHAIAHAIAEQ